MAGYWPDAKYRVGYQGYLRYTPTAILVPPTAVVDPVAATGASIVGPCSLPSFDRSENMRPIEAAGAARALGAFPGRREITTGTRVEVCDPTFLGTLGNFLRDHTTGGNRSANPAYIGGLWNMAVEIGLSSSEYVDEAAALQCLDCLGESMRLEIAEGQNVVANVAWVPICMVAGVPSTADTSFSARPMIWQSTSLALDSTGYDYKTGLARITLGVQNQIERVGCRDMGFTGGGDELVISRTAYALKPKLEQLQLSYQWHSDPPASFLKVLDHGGVTLVAWQYGYGSSPARKQWTLNIAHNHLNRLSQPETAANTMTTYTTDMLSYALTSTIVAL